jgi:hypothetical protein
MDNNSANQEPVIKFRNYAPRDAALASLAAPLPAAPSAQAADVAAAASDAAAAAPAPDAPVLIVPKKPNWDLKRDLAPKLELLSKLTQRAIGQIVREQAAAAATPAQGGGGGGVGGGGGGGGSAPPSHLPTAATVPRGAVLDEVYHGAFNPAILARGTAEQLDEDA